MEGTRTRPVLTKVETCRLSDVMADLSAFPEMVRGYFVIYRTVEDEVKLIFDSNHIHELLGDIAVGAFTVTESAAGQADAELEIGDADGDDN